MPQDCKHGFERGCVRCHPRGKRMPRLHRNLQIQFIQKFESLLRCTEKLFEAYFKTEDAGLFTEFTELIAVLVKASELRMRSMSLRMDSNFAEANALHRESKELISEIRKGLEDEEPMEE